VAPASEPPQRDTSEARGHRPAGPDQQASERAAD
jgi:hypothetical protein